MQARPHDRIRRPGHALGLTSRSASFDPRSAHDGEQLSCLHNLVPWCSDALVMDTDNHSSDAWVELGSEPSSSSLSSIGEDANIASTRVHQDPRGRRRRSLRQDRASNFYTAARRHNAGMIISQKEYEESESESDKILSSSGEGEMLPAVMTRPSLSPGPDTSSRENPKDHIAIDEDDDDENRTTVNYPMSNDQCFTPQPNAFSHPPNSQMRHASQPVPGSYFPAPSQRASIRPSTRSVSSGAQAQNKTSHMPQNMLSPSYTAAIHHEEALRTSLNTLLSCAAAARSLPKSESSTKAQSAIVPQPRPRRAEPMSFQFIPESALPAAVTSPPPQFQEYMFKPTLCRDNSTSTSASSEPQRHKEHKRKAAIPARNSSRERRVSKKARRSSSSTAEELYITPTLLTWVVSAGVVVLLSALSFSAGYNLGKEAGRREVSSLLSDDPARSCARAAGRSGLGLKRSLARTAVQV